MQPASKSEAAHANYANPNGYLNWTFNYSSPQKDPSAERNAVPRKAKQLGILVD